MIKIPQFLSHLKVFGDYPVPFVQLWIDGKPDFRAIDPDKVDQCLGENLCAICGKRLGEFCYFVGGEACKEGHEFMDPAMHEECAGFASRTCPFLTGQRSEYSKRAIDKEKVFTVPIVSSSRPAHMYIFKTRTKTVQFAETSHGVIIRAGSWSKISEIAQGKDSTGDSK